MTEAEIAAVYRRHIVMVRRCAERIVLDRAAAEDVAQETFVKFLEYGAKGGSARDTAALLYRIATNLALTRIRTAKRRRELLDRERNNRARVESTADDRLSMQRVLGGVSEEEARIALSYYVEGLEQEEIAELLSMERRTVGRRLESFRSQARRLLEDRKARGET